MRRPTPLLILFLAVSGPAWGYTQAEIDQAAIVAAQIDIVRSIAGSLFLGRNNNTPGSTAIQTVLIDELKLVSDGLNQTQTGDDAYRQSFSTTAIGTNLLGVIPGTDLANEYVMVGAHYDHLGFVGPAIFNGATDNAAGVAAVLAIGAAIQALPTPPRRSIILALWDAEEDGLVGSLAYTNAPLVPLASTVAYINFDIQGANLLPSLRNTSFAIAAESGGPSLEVFVQDAVAQESVDTRLLTESFGQNRSDYARFLDVGVPTVFFSDAPGPCYHTSGDDASVVDLGKLREQSQIAFRLTVELAETAAPPAFVATGLPIYADAVVLADVGNGAVADLDLFTPADQTLLLGYQATLNTIVDDGPSNFDSLDVTALAVATLGTLDALSRVQCDGFVVATPHGVPAQGWIGQFAVVVLFAASGYGLLRRKTMTGSTVKPQI